MSEPAPKVGEHWRLDDEPGDPWGLNRAPIVEIRDVKDGWVRYSFPSRGEDWCMKLELFVQIYGRVRVEA